MVRTVGDLLDAFQGDHREREGLWPRWRSAGNSPEMDTGTLKHSSRLDIGLAVGTPL